MGTFVASRQGSYYLDFCGRGLTTDQCNLKRIRIPVIFNLLIVASFVYLRAHRC